MTFAQQHYARLGKVIGADLEHIGYGGRRVNALLPCVPLSTCLSPRRPA
jgi:hypothetical protein